MKRDWIYTWNSNKELIHKELSKHFLKVIFHISIIFWVYTYIYDSCLQYYTWISELLNLSSNIAVRTKKPPIVFQNFVQAFHSRWPEDGNICVVHLFHCQLEKILISAVYPVVDIINVLDNHERKTFKLQNTVQVLLFGLVNSAM